jgi:hypothetical protein
MRKAEQEREEKVERAVRAETKVVSPIVPLLPVVVSKVFYALFETVSRRTWPFAKLILYPMYGSTPLAITFSCGTSTSAHWMAPWRGASSTWR